MRDHEKDLEEKRVGLGALGSPMMAQSPMEPEEMRAHRLRHRVRELDNIFTYHSPKNDQAQRYNILRSQARHLATMIVELTPESREQSIALTNLEQAIFWANASIARNE